jgi:hypothetical protein
MPKLKCFLCTDLLEQRTDKNGKPYFVCDPCGTQYFVRKPTGIAHLNALTKKKPQQPKPPTWLKDVEDLKLDSYSLDQLDLVSEEDQEWLSKFQEALQDCLVEIENHFEAQRT